MRILVAIVSLSSCSCRGYVHSFSFSYQDTFKIESKHTPVYGKQVVPSK